MNAIPERLHKDVNVLVRMSSQEFGNEDFPRESMREALETIQSLVAGAVAQDDGIERLIGIVVNASSKIGTDGEVE